MTGRKFLVLAVIFWILVMGAIVIYDQWKIDACLDAGGSFDYGRFICDVEESHPSGSYVFAGVSVALAVYFYLTFRFLRKLLGWGR